MTPTFSAKIFTGTANPTLAKDISNHLNALLGHITVEQFSDGEVRVEIEETIRGEEIYIIQPTSAPANDNLMELLIMADAAKRSACERITAVIPYYGYSRQDRRPDFTRTPITSRLVADMLQAAGINRVIVVDLHSGQQQGFFNIPVTNISAAPEIVGDIWRRHRRSNIVIVSPDAGGVDRARHIAKQVNAELAIVDKRRPKANVSQVMNIIGEVDGRICIIIDDMIDTAGTLCKGAQALKDQGATKVIAYATHPVFSGEAYNNIHNSCLDEVVVTDTIPLPPIWSSPESKVRVLSIASLLGETISRIQARKSISEIYT